MANTDLAEAGRGVQGGHASHSFARRFLLCCITKSRRQPKLVSGSVMHAISLLSLLDMRPFFDALIRQTFPRSQEHSVSIEAQFGLLKQKRPCFDFE